jgi:SHC-transforming protein 1
MESPRAGCDASWEDIENAIMNGGVNFSVKYIGCIEITESMKRLDFQSRSLVAKECINRVCDFANLRSPKKRRVEKRIQQVISTQPCMEHSGTNVILNISSGCLQLTNSDTNEIIAKHDMPRISFASGGDSDSVNFVAYVAKDFMEWRACYVLDCGSGKAQTVISTMGQAFELRYKNFCNDDAERMHSWKRHQKPEIQHSPPAQKCEQEYYNDLPDKVPPQLEELPERRRERLTSNLIDLGEHNDYVNDEAAFPQSNNSNNNNNNNNNATFSDVFNCPFDTTPYKLSAELQYSQLLIENWFHGPISRNEAELFLKNDGDFLVRESQQPGQFVLSGLNGTPKHLLLIDPQGIIRTKDRIFESITHLINYHWSNCLPIISSDSCLLLRTPVIRTTDLRK